MLTFYSPGGILGGYGELSERFKEPVLKTGDSERNLGFESLTLRQRSSHPFGGVGIFYDELRFERPLRKHASGMFLGSWRIRVYPDTSMRI